MHLSLLPRQRAASAPAAPAVADEFGSLDNATFLEKVEHAAGVLAQRGVGRDSVVALILPNGGEFVIALFAGWRLGAAVTPVNPQLAAPEIAYQLADSGARVVVTSPEYSERVPDTSLPVVTLRGSAAVTAEPFDPGLPDSDVALLIYTSGTTGRPKGVMLTHANLTAMSDMLIDELELDETAHALLILPLFHANAILLSTLSPLRAGGRMTITRRFDRNTFFDLVERVRPTYFSGVPTIFAMLTELPAASRYDTSSLRFAVCGAAPASRELLTAFPERFGIPIIEGYGLSEGTCASTINPLRGVRKVGTVGRVIRGQRLRLVGPDGKDVREGESGEVVIAGPNVMRGYLNRDEETATTIVDGWLHTGDIGRLDEDGYLTIVDRIKDMIIKGGENIYPKEIENVAYQLPAVLEAAVVGRPHQRLGEVPVLFVAARDDAYLHPDAVTGHLSEQLSSFKLPSEVIVLHALPKNPVGKIDKPSLRRTLHNTPLGVAPR